MPKPGHLDGTEAQVVLEPSSFARELAASARRWADDAKGSALAATATEEAATTTAATATATPQPLPPQPPRAEARGRDPRSNQPGGWVGVRVVDSCTASGPEGSLRFCVEIEGGGGEEEEEKEEKEEKKERERFWVPLAWLHPSTPSPLLALRPPSPPAPNETEVEPVSSWSAGDEAEVRRDGERGWWPATVLEVKKSKNESENKSENGNGDGNGDGNKDGNGVVGVVGGESGGKPPLLLAVRIEPCSAYPMGAVVDVPINSSSSPYSARRRPPLPPLFEEEAARLQLEQARAERSGRLGGGSGPRGGVLGSGRRWSGMATSFGESVHPEEWRRRTAGLLVAEEEEEGEEGQEGAEGKKNDESGGGGGEGERKKKRAPAAAGSGPSAGVSSGARTHLIAGFSVEAALCPGQLSTATTTTREEEEEEEEVEELEEGGDGGKKEGAAAAAGEEAPQNKKRKTTATPLGSRTNRDPFGYDAAARALLEAGGGL